MHDSVPQKLVLSCNLSLGDIVMLTAAVRDLHLRHPGRFLTDVRTCFPDLWLNNPFITHLDTKAPDVRVLNCTYPLINDCDSLPVHCLQGFIHFLNEKLHLDIRLTRIAGAIRLSEEEKQWASQVHELAGRDIPFWLITSGGKYDATVKWWDKDRYQAVVDQLQGKVAFVQVGHQGDHHPKIQGAIDLRGQTTVRELIRLLYHSEGVLCPITGLMHLSAAVEGKRPERPLRPTVVVAGGREPAHWEQYPGHQFLHTIGMLPCCARSGCWRDRVVPLGDDDRRDEPQHLCLLPTNGHPKCMEMIDPAHVISRITAFHEAGMARFLTAQEAKAARRAIAATEHFAFENLPLTEGNARLRCEEFIRTSAELPLRHSGKGIVMCVGGTRYFTNAYVTIRMLRHLGCTLPIEAWYLGRQEMDAAMRKILAPYGVEFRDAQQLRKNKPVRLLGGYQLKAFALLHSQFEEVLFLDADNVPVKNPEYLFTSPQYRKFGAIFWPDYGHFRNTKRAWKILGMSQPAHPEFESGQMLVNKGRHTKPLRLALWFNENSDFFYRLILGDKETFHLAFRKLEVPFFFVPHRIRTLHPGTMCQHDPDGARLFQHRNGDKWNLFLLNRQIAGFEHEPLCRNFVEELRSIWDGRASKFLPALYPEATKPSVRAIMVSFPGREDVAKETLDRLARTDWVGTPKLIVGRGSTPELAVEEACLRAFSTFLAGEHDYLLLLEDDLKFNRHLRANLAAWAPLQSKRLTLGSLYNPGLPEAACQFRSRSYVVAPEVIFGSQALLISRACVKHMVAGWDRLDYPYDQRIARLAGKLQSPILYHAPSLVQHQEPPRSPLRINHRSKDFSYLWRPSDEAIARML